MVHTGASGRINQYLSQVIDHGYTEVPIPDGLWGVYNEPYDGDDTFIATLTRASNSIDALVASGSTTERMDAMRRLLDSGQRKLHEMEDAATMRQRIGEASGAGQSPSPVPSASSEQASGGEESARSVTPSAFDAFDP